MQPGVQTQAVPENPLLDDKVKPAAELQRIYDAKDEAYLGFMQSRLERAKLQKDQPMPEFKGKTYYQIFDENEKLANTVVEMKKNPDDVIISSGTVEQKLDALLSHINNLNLTPEVMAFDKENVKVTDLNLALQDIMHDCAIRDGGDGGGDEEKRALRQRELLKQGTVFVQEEWLKRWETKKILKEKYNGEFKNFAGYTSKLVKVFEGPSRTLLYGPNVFLGDITQFYMENQPYMYVLIQTNYENAKSKYGKFENFDYVQKGAVPSTEATSQKTIYDNKWRLTELQNDQVEIILYMDKPNDEFQIIINGVLMLPVGFPLSAVSPKGEYNVAKQVYRVINDKFAYGQSFVASGSVKEISAIIDEMLKLFVLKTRKSFTPAYVNTSGRVIDKKVLSPGRISMGIEPGALVPIAGNEVQGVTAGEAAVLEKLQSLIDKSTVSEQFTGQQGKSGTTATEVVELQRQARLTLGLTIAACVLLEVKIGYLRLWNILENWFEPLDTRVEGINEARKLVNEYRSTTRDVSIDGEGPGERSVVVRDEAPPDDQTIRNEELAAERTRRIPVRKIYIRSSREEGTSSIQNACLYWYIVVNTQERESSPFFKMLFREMLGDMLTLLQLGSVPNKEGLEEEFAKVWGKPRNKLFSASQSVSPEMAGASIPGGGSMGAQPGMPSGRSNQTGSPMAPGGLAMAGGGGS